jgi:hypothetical protein
MTIERSPRVKDRRPLLNPLARCLAFGLAAAALALAAAAAPAKDKTAAETGAATAPLFAKSQWTVASTSCPIGCGDAMRDFLKAQMGHAVRLSATTFEAPFLDPCEGNIRWVPSTSTFAELAAELARSTLDGSTIKAADLGVAEGATLHRAVAYCASGGFDLPFARLLSIEPDRIVVLFEQQSLIVLR